jgi:hypothetical protein
MRDVIVVALSSDDTVDVSTRAMAASRRRVRR